MHGKCSMIESLVINFQDYGRFWSWYGPFGIFGDTEWEFSGCYFFWQPFNILEIHYFSVKDNNWRVSFQFDLFWAASVSLLCLLQVQNFLLSHCVCFVLVPPIITRNEKTIEVVPRRRKRFRTLIGSSISSPPSIAITIVCLASGKPTPTVTWTRNGIPVKRSNNVKILKKGRLRIKSFSSDDVGRYQCVASNIYGTDRATSSLNIKGMYNCRMYKWRLTLLSSFFHKCPLFPCLKFKSSYKLKSLKAAISDGKFCLAYGKRLLRGGPRLDTWL